MVSYVRGPSYKSVKAFNKISALRAYSPFLAVWGAAAGIAVLTFGEHVPLIRNTFLRHIPVVGDHYVYNPDPEDIPV
ncbi:hypothetical protein BABINDRAFT_147617 [Babjeviella inositovora NRRL Y-12698]|uniref:Cytochrome b-c1 complex subunit 10 n=1 Tax=Babjeviella inositovora NRRL Y-12698 TaxID=984486 RepID=A0A1E3QN02_9ASCO|nr:uncharacterized protein BABINDRAFT_147617 [Babjeviella inositovora NRRL Y-12698]ODQ79065.1 hypothetical protein BABINDRAFT_147617 [Babjeviella inositovora NRRL Y-12698]